MPSGFQRYVVCYDIADDKRRRRIADILDGLGDRVQESVFEAVLDRRRLAVLIAELDGEIDAAADRISVYPLCATCDGKRVDLGQAANESPPGRDEIVIL